MGIADDLSKITSIINTLHPQAQIYLFGSCANGTMRADSDIDLCVVVPSLDRNRFEIMDEMREAIHEKTEYAIDLLLFSRTEFEDNVIHKSRIQYAIAQKGVLLNA